MEITNPFTGIRAVAMPFSDACQPLCSDNDAFQCFWQRLISFGRSRKWRSVELRGGRTFVSGAPASNRFFGHRLDLAKDPSSLFASFESATRRAIRRASHQGVRTKIDTGSDAFQVFYRLLCLTRKRHGVPPPPYSFFRNLHQQVISKGQGCLIQGIHNDQVVAGAVFLYLGNRVFYKYGASDESFQHLRANNLVMWEAIKWHAANGFGTLDFGRTDLCNEGLRRFKLGWGAEEYPIEYLKFDLESGSFLEASSNAFRTPWYAPLFRRMPVVLSRLIGRALYRFIG